MRRYRLTVLGGMAVALTGAPAMAADEGGDITLTGQVGVSAEHSGKLGAGDRLVIKLYHPRDGVEYDTKYQIIDEFSLPYAFRAVPSVDMNARARWSNYIIEIFTDRDGDVLTLVPGEMVARTEEPVTLGTRGLALELKPIE